MKKKEKAQGKSKKKLYIILGVVAVLFVIGMIGGNEEDADSQEAMGQTAEQEISDSDLSEDIQEPEIETESKPESQESESDNPLMAAEVSIGDVMNGTGTDKLGEWAEVSISKETLKGITQEQFAEFCNGRVDGSGYNWYTISCEDGTGIQFAGSISYVATYGTLDNEGCIIESAGTIMVQEDGTYSYTESE